MDIPPELLMQMGMGGMGMGGMPGLQELANMQQGAASPLPIHAHPQCCRG